jgi:hypothetical protein
MKKNLLPTTSLQPSFLSNPAVIAGVVFGSPNRSCKGAGICKIIEIKSFSVREANCRSCKTGIAWIEPLSNRSIKFVFLKESMNISTLRKQFHKGWFELPDNLKLPSFLSGGLLSGEKRVCKGKYPVMESEFFLTVAMDVVVEPITEFPEKYQASKI